MSIFIKKDKKRAALEKEYASVLKKETQLKQSAMKTTAPRWKTDLEKKVPEKVYRSLETAFSKAFSVVFTQGVGVIEKTYNRQNLEETHSVQDYAVQVKGGRKELKQVKRNAGRSGLTNTALTIVEGIGLGALGIGLPDIVVFVGMLLKGVYETALSYGFAYDTPEERLFILRMMETALTKGPDFAVKNARVDGMIEEMPQTGEDELQAHPEDRKCFCGRHAAPEIRARVSACGYPWRRGQSRLLQQGHALCAAQVSKTVPVGSGPA